MIYSGFALSALPVAMEAVIPWPSVPGGWNLALYVCRVLIGVFRSDLLFATVQHDLACLLCDLLSVSLCRLLLVSAVLFVSHCCVMLSSAMCSF